MKIKKWDNEIVDTEDTAVTSVTIVTAVTTVTRGEYLSLNGYGAKAWRQEIFLIRWLKPAAIGARALVLSKFLNSFSTYWCEEVD